MKKISIFFLILNIFCTDFLIYSKPKNEFSAVSSSFPDGTKSGIIHNDIGRAGVILVVPLNNGKSDPFEKYGIIVGYDKNIDSWMVGQAGRCDNSDTATHQTASRELEEETGGYFKMNAEKISTLPYLSAGQKQMYIYKSDDKTLASKIKSAVKKIQFNKDIDESYKEINDVEVVSLKEMFQLADAIDQCEITRGKYLVTTVSKKQIVLNTLYSQIFAHPCDHTRLEYAKKMFEMLLK